jgi:hypothetical protein
VFAWLFVFFGRCLPSLALPTTESPFMGNSVRLALHSRGMSKFSRRTLRAMNQAYTWLPDPRSWMSPPGLSTLPSGRCGRRATMRSAKCWPFAVQPLAIRWDCRPVKLMDSATHVTVRWSWFSVSSATRDIWSRGGVFSSERSSMFGSLGSPCSPLRRR